MDKIRKINEQDSAQSASRNITWLKTTLDRAKDELYDMDGKLNRALFKDTLVALGTISKLNSPILTNEMFELLKSKDELIREETVATLGYTTRLHLPEFRDKAYEILSNDPSPCVRATALSAWAGYFFKSYNPSTLWRIYLILVNESNDLMLRAEAFCGICNIAPNEYPGFNPVFSLTPLLESETTEEFNSKIDWNEVERIINKYVPPEMRNEK